MTGYWPYRIAAFLSRALPERLAYWVGLRFSDLFYRRDQKGRAAVMGNIATVLRARGVQPARDALDGFARKTFQYFGKYLVDFFRFSRLTQEDIERRVSIEHRERLDQSLALGRGLILVTAHFGNWELGGAVIAGLGYPVNAVVLPQRLEKLNRLFQGQRERRGLRVIPMGSSVFNLIRCLRRKELLALLADRDFTGKSDPVEFFGKPAHMPVGPAWLSFKTGAPVLVGFLIREVDDTFRLRLYPPILPGPDASIEGIRARINEILEKEIAERPYQWFMFDPFWDAQAPVQAAQAPAPFDEAGPVDYVAGQGKTP
ncbi:MAG TPA: lysophospholipid acyltransferase family protein [Kiritimatiellia bacterium]|nr:lysophospholipid acyltransferase family protein [Kiritimatiellia bacterium]HRZ13190.1 lysophospholipid acyltransferase family protein [Kiritimatiellia bacterium]HSA19757.1 lysophospholipid acyltransferase family protein [Kiritimatiellia bacterium]